MIIDCISDLHGYKPKLQGGDLLIVAGDLTGCDRMGEYRVFTTWVQEQKYDKVVIIAGNHDVRLETGNFEWPVTSFWLNNVSYLLDSGITYKGLKIWGSPWTKQFTGQNDNCKAFSFRTEYQLQDHFRLIPEGTDILVTHSPSFGILDECDSGRVGSTSLRTEVARVQPRLHVHGHIHSGYGVLECEHTKVVNAAHCNEYYDPVNAPIRIEL